MEDKLNKLADLLVNYSLKVEKDERVLICIDNMQTKDLVKYLIECIYNAGGVVNVKMVDKELNALLMEKANELSIENLVKQKWFEVDNYDSFINIRYNINDYEDKIISKDMQKILDSRTIYADDIRINKRKWVLLNYPSYLDANKAKMNTREYKNFALNVMTMNYEKMNKDLQALKGLMERTDKVRLTGLNTDLTFSIKNMPAIVCAGESNIPDGEVFTAPIRDSVNGYITYNTPSPYKGNVYHNIKLVFKDGKIIEATSDDDNEELNKIFNTDEGSRYIGEFSLGINNLIMDPMGDILYDEKIFGSIHFTPGRAYKDAYNGNDSAVHWDLVLIQRESYGGGEIYFDDKLIRKDGLFVIPDLKVLNKGV